MLFHLRLKMKLTRAELWRVGTQSEIFHGGSKEMQGTFCLMRASIRVKMPKFRNMIAPFALSYLRFYSFDMPITNVLPVEVGLELVEGLIERLVMAPLKPPAAQGLGQHLRGLMAVGFHLIDL